MKAYCWKLYEGGEKAGQIGKMAVMHETSTRKVDHLAWIILLEHCDEANRWYATGGRMEAGVYKLAEQVSDTTANWTQLRNMADNET